MENETRHMGDYNTAIALAGYAIGAFGSLLIFIELFQLPSYVEYKPKLNRYDLQVKPIEVRQYTVAGKAGALMVALAFSLEFIAILV
jgi:hypothetical protein